jgi:hypothetical protein
MVRINVYDIFKIKVNSNSHIFVGSISNQLQLTSVNLYYVKLKFN